MGRSPKSHRKRVVISICQVCHTGGYYEPLTSKEMTKKTIDTTKTNSNKGVSRNNRVTFWLEVGQ